ncbi:MAG: hypothetical protein J6M60_01985 [Clostridia bacterium]|nr:hypothetical protein [Clostridia bacterium]
MRKKYEVELKELQELRTKSEMRSTDPEGIKEIKSAQREFNNRLFKKYGLMGPIVLKQIENVLEFKNKILDEASKVDDRTIELNIEKEKVEKEIASFNENNKKVAELDEKFHDLIEKEVEIQAKLKTATSEDEKKSLMEELEKVAKQKEENNKNTNDLNKDINSTSLDELNAKKEELQSKIDESNKESNELKNKAARCDLVATRLLQGKEWKDIELDLKNFKDREFKCKDKKLYIPKKQAEVIKNENNFKEYNRRVEERIQGFEKINGRPATEAEKDQIRNEVLKDMKKEQEKVDSVSKKLEENAAKMEKAAKAEEAAKKAEEATNGTKTEKTSELPNELGKKGEYSSLKADLLKDIKNIGDAAKAEEAKKEEAKGADKAPEKSEEKVGFFAALKNWWNGLFNKDKTKKLNPADVAKAEEEAKMAEEEAAKKAAEEAKKAEETIKKAEAEKEAKAAEEKKENDFKSMYKSKDFDGVIRRVSEKGIDVASEEISNENKQNRDKKLEDAKKQARERDVQNEAARLRAEDAKNGKLKYAVTDTGFADIDKQYYENKAREKYDDEAR